MKILLNLSSNPNVARLKKKQINSKVILEKHENYKDRVDNNNKANFVYDLLYKNNIKNKAIKYSIEN